MTVSLLLRVSGNYVATLKSGLGETIVGPGAAPSQLAEKYVNIPHGPGSHDFSLEERPATPEEIEAANTPPDAAA